MRLFGKVDGSIDRYDRAEWLTGPFDLAFAAGAAPVPGPYRVAAAQVYSSGATAGQCFSIGAAAGEVFSAGAVAGQIV